MDNVVINITELPNNVSFQIIEGGGGMQCADLAACQTIIDIEANLSTVISDLSTHESNTSNPHNVTKSQVGLGNVDNTSDLNKPVSTAQQTALNLKEDVANKSTSVNTDQASNTKYPSVKAVYDWAIGLFLKKGTITNNTILKGSGTDTATDSNITDDGTTVTVNSEFYVNSGGTELSAQNNAAYISADESVNTKIETTLTENTIKHDVKNVFDAPANNFPHLRASQRVETDENKNLISVPNEIDYTESFAYTGSRFTLTVAPSFIYSIRTTSMILDENDANDVTIVGTTLTVINPAFESGETLYIKYKA